MLYSWATFGEEIVKGRPVTVEMLSPDENPVEEEFRKGSCM